MIDAELLQMLVCPACRQTLEFMGGEKPAGLCCRNCMVVYPVQSDIPVMLKEEAIPLADWENGKRKK